MVAGPPVVLVTGASAGFGEAIAHRFAAAGYRIVAIARRRAPLESLSQALAPAGVRVLAMDVTASDAAERAVDLAMTAFGRLDCLVNNAGSGKWGPVHATDDSTLDEVIETSLKAPFRFARAALRVMGPGCSIINIGSTFGLIGGLDGGAYCAAKAGLIGLTQTIAAQYGAKGIRSNLVAPGAIKTDMTKEAWDKPAFHRLNQEMTPCNRDGTAADVGEAVFFLASEAAGFINGQTLALDGGWSTTKFLSYTALTCRRVER